MRDKNGFSELKRIFWIDDKSYMKWRLFLWRVILRGDGFMERKAELHGVEMGFFWRVALRDDGFNKEEMGFIIMKWVL